MPSWSPNTWCLSPTKRGFVLVYLEKAATFLITFLLQFSLPSSFTSEIFCILCNFSFFIMFFTPLSFLFSGILIAITQVLHITFFTFRDYFSLLLRIKSQKISVCSCLFHYYMKKIANSTFKNL